MRYIKKKDTTMLGLDQYRCKEIEKSILKKAGLSIQEAKALEEQVLNNLYNSMSLQERRIIDIEGQKLNEFFFLPSLAMKMLSKSPQAKNAKITKEDEAKIEKPSGPLAMIWSIIKKVGLMTFIAAIIYLGFRFDAIRSLFPFLAPLADKIGTVFKWIGTEYLWPAFQTVVKSSVDAAIWLVKKALDLFGLTDPIKKAGKLLMDTSEKANDLIGQAFDALRPTPSGYDPTYNQSSKDRFGNIDTRSVNPSISRADKDLEFFRGVDAKGGLEKVIKDIPGSSKKPWETDVDQMKRVFLPK
jgi:hypothetical protein